MNLPRYINSSGWLFYCMFHEYLYYIKMFPNNYHDILLAWLLIEWLIDWLIERQASVVSLVTRHRDITYTCESMYHSSAHITIHIITLQIQLHNIVSVLGKEFNMSLSSSSLYIHSSIIHTFSLTHTL